MSEVNDSAEAPPTVRLYAAKVVLKSVRDNLMHPISVYAADDSSAERAVRALPEVDDVDKVIVGAVEEHFLGRHPDDGRGVVQHSDYSWSSRTSDLQVAKLF
jgi:hypothetical protein